MSFLDEITPLVISYNEAPNIARMLDWLVVGEADRRLDSGSTDGTAEFSRVIPRSS